jgi:uroporphyrinogen-III synthase
VRAFDAKRFVQLTETRLPLAVTCTSASTAVSLLESLEAAGARGALAGVGVISIGPITSEALAARGVVANGEARPYTLAGVVAAMVAWYEGLRSFPGAAP